MNSRFDLSLFATNVTNLHYIAYVPGLVQSVNFETASLGEPRMFGMRVRYHFGS
jgi:iron complex outermembrane receptor protein